MDWAASSSAAYAVTARHLAGWNDDSRHLVRHVLASGLIHELSERWVPVSGDLIRGRRSIRLEGRLPAADVLGLVAAGVLERKAHVAPEGHARGKGKSAEYRLATEIQAEYDAALGTGRAVNLFTGKATTKRPKTTRHDENRHANPALIQAGMDGVAVGLFHLADATDHVALSLALAEGAEAYAAGLVGAAGETLANCRAVRIAAAAVRDAEAAGEAPPFDADTLAALGEAQTLRGRYSVDNAVLAKLNRHADPEDEDGACRYEPAYKPQRFGRLTDTFPGIQNATREMKQACWKRVPNVFNYDLKSSQPRQLRSWFELAGIPTNELEAVLLGDKATAAASVGVTVDGWKGATMALVMGGILYADLDAGTDADGVPRGEVVDLILTASLLGDKAADAYKAFEARTRLLYTQLQAFRHYLVHVWLPANEYRGKNGQRFVRNATGAVFNVSDTLDKNGRTTAKTGRDLAAFILQGAEAAFVYTLTVLAPQYGFRVLANEHDGLVTLGVVPPAAIAEAKRLTGLDSAELVEKPFV